jgi:ribosomal protein S12
MNYKQKLEKLQALKAELMSAPDYPNLDALPRSSPFCEESFKIASANDSAHRAVVRVNLSKVNAAIAFVEQQINLEYCLSL